VSGPLDSLRVVEFAGIGPGPFAGMLLADLGADVLRLERPSGSSKRRHAAYLDVLQRGKHSVGVDLKCREGVELALDLVAVADAVIEGFRPGVMERLGLGPDRCLARNPRLAFGRMTGWGQTGPLAPRAGHDINYVALAGPLAMIGRPGDRPVPPLNLVGDFGGGGLLLAFGLLAAIITCHRTGSGQVVDATMIDGASLLSTLFYGLRAEGSWIDERGTNLLDSGAPFYEVYQCADGAMVAVGALESEFYAQLLDVMGLTANDLPTRMERGNWPALKATFAEVFASRARDEWLKRAEGTDACLAPVLSLSETVSHPHHVARQSFVEVAGLAQPAPAPRFGRTPAATPLAPLEVGVQGYETLAAWGIERSRVDELVRGGIVKAE